MRYHLDITENKDGKHLLHSDDCTDKCPAYKEMQEKRSSDKIKSMSAALAWAKKEYPQWSNIEFCPAEKKLLARQNSQMIQLVFVGIVFAAVVAGFVMVFLWAT